MKRDCGRYAGSTTCRSPREAISARSAATVSISGTARGRSSTSSRSRRKQRAFDWFIGWNDLGLELYSPEHGGCRDGLHVDRVNGNQGAESTLAFLLSLTEMRQAQAMVLSFQEAVMHEPMARMPTGTDHLSSEPIGPGTIGREVMAVSA